MSTLADRRDAATAAEIDRVFGTSHGAEIVRAAKRDLALAGRGIGHPVSLLAAIVQTESNGQNIFGHDPTIYAGAGEVTKAKYLAYKAERGHSQMQGVGLPQLTWWEFQDEADRLGGCWVPEHQLAVAAIMLARLVRQYGLRGGVRRYNGSGPGAYAYAALVLVRYAAWWARFRRVTRRVK